MKNKSPAEVDIHWELSDFAEWAAGLEHESLPDRVISKARLVLLDDLGAMIGGGGEPELEAYREKCLSASGNPEATIFAEGFPRTDTYRAAELNGMAGCWLEVDEGYRLATSHAGIYALPALVAVSESMGLTVRQLLEGLVVGYEVAARYAHAWSFPPLTIHPHGAFSPVGTAAAVAKAQGYSSGELLQAILTASALTVTSPYNHATQGALVRNVWTGVGARLGLMACDLASCGISGLSSSPADAFGTALQGVRQPGALSKGLGETYAIESGYHKPYACCQYAHASIEALLELRARHKGRDWASEVESLVVETHPKGLSLDVSHPTTTLGAKFSLPHAVAAGLVYGTGGPKAFSKESLANRAVRALAEVVELTPIEGVGEWPEDRPSRILIRFTDGSEDSARCVTAKGDPSKPLALEDLVEKFVEVTGPVFTTSAARSSAAQILSAPADRTVGEFVSSLTATEV